MIYNSDNLYITRIKDNLKIKCVIELITKSSLPKKKDGWWFNWSNAYRKQHNSIFGLIEQDSRRIHGLIQLIQDEGMLIMELIELPSFNFGSSKEYENVAGCLIAFGCRETLKLNNAYKGYLTFISKTELVELYKTKYFATQTLGTRMYIDPISGEKLITQYLNYEN